jgi:hypothetical protein
MQRLRQAHVSNINAPIPPAEYSFGVASGVDAPLSTFSRVLGRGAQAGAATRRCPTLLQQEKNTRQMCKASMWPPVWPPASTPRYENMFARRSSWCPCWYPDRFLQRSGSVAAG